MNKISPYSDNLYNCFLFSDPDSYSERCKKKTEWVMRGRVEAAFCKNLVFITLTYAPKNLPTTYKRVSSLPLFSQRETRKMYKLYDENGLVGKKWVTRKSQALNLKDNVYRHKEIFSEQDFKNAKFAYMHSKEYVEGNRNVGLLVPKHLSDFLVSLRDAIRKKYNDKYISLRYIANGEYGQNASRRPHFHILIFNSYDFDFDKFTRQNWKYAKIIQCDVVDVKSKISVTRLTTYICAHTVKNDRGNTYQNELSPSFRLLCGGEGIGYQLTDDSLMRYCTDSYVTSLSFSLLNWDKRSPLKYQVTDDKNNVYIYEFPRYYKDKMLKYLSLDIRQYHTAQCRSIVNIISNFCKFANIHGNFDLLPIYYNIGLIRNPFDLLKFFLQINYKKIAKNFSNLEMFYNFAKSYLQDLHKNDKLRRDVFKERYSRRKQNVKYINYCKSKGYEVI